MQKFIIAGLLALLPTVEANAFFLRAQVVARVKVQNVVERVVVQKQIIQQVNVVERVRFANIIAPTYAVQQLVLPVYQQQYYAPPVQQYAQPSASCTEQLRLMDKQIELLRAENQNLTLKLQAK